MPIGQIVDPFASKAAESEAIDLATTLDPDIEKKIIMSGIIADELGLDGDFSGASYEVISRETGRTGNLDLDFQQEQLKAIGSYAKLNSKGLQAWSNGFKRGGIRAAQYADSIPALLIQNRIEGLRTLADREKSFIEKWNAGELEEQQEIAEKYNMQREASLLGFLWPKRMTSKEMFDNYSYSLPKYEEQIAKLEAQRDEQIKDFVRKQVNLLAIPVSEGLERFRTEEGSLTELFSPTTFGELLIEELTASSPSLVAMVGGSALGGIATGVGAGALTTMAQSTSANFFGYLSQNGVDISNQQAVTEKLNDKKFFQEALDYAMLRAAPEAIVESLAFASAGKIGSAAFNALAIQPGAAGLGALAADLIVGEDPSFKDIATEMLIELPVGSIEVLSQRLLNGSSAWKAMMMDEATPPDSRLIKKMVEATSMEEFTNGMTPEEALVLEKVIEDSPGAEELVAKIVESQKAVEGLGIAEEFTPPRTPIEIQEEELLLLAEGIRAVEVEAGVDLDVVDETVGVELEGASIDLDERISVLKSEIKRLREAANSDKDNSKTYYDEYEKLREQLRLLEFEKRNPGAKSLNREEADKYISNLIKLNDNVKKNENDRFWKKGEKISKSPDLGGKFKAILQKGTKVFRSVTLKDWERIQSNGKIDSDLRDTISNEEGINLAFYPESSRWYIPDGETSVILAIDTDGLDGLFMIGADDYLRSNQPIPIENIVAVSNPIGKDLETSQFFIPAKQQEAGPREMPIRGPNERDKAKAAAVEEAKAKKIEKDIQSELKEINEAIEVQLERAQPEEGKAKPPKELTKREEASVSKLLNHISGQGKKLSPKELAVTREKIRGDVRLAKRVQKELIRRQDAIKAERTKADARVFAEKEKAANKEERLIQKINTLGLKLRTTVRDLKKEHLAERKQIIEEARQQARNKRWEESEKRRSVTEAIRRVEALHRKLNAKLPKGNKLKPMTVADISRETKLKALENLLNKKLENLETSFQEEIVAVKKANLEKDLTKIIKDIKQAKKRKKKTPWAPEYTEGLTNYLDLLGLTDNSEAAIKRARLDLEDLNRRIDEQENYELTDEDNDIVERSQIPLLKEDLTEDTIDDISENIKAIKKEGVTKRKADVLNENKKIKALSETIKLELSKTEGRADAREVAQIRSFIAKYGSELATYQTMSVMLTGKKRSKIESLFDSISEAFSEGILMQQRFSGKNGLLEKKLEELEIDISSVGTNQLLTVGNRAMSLHEAMFVYGHNQNARGRGHLSATNFGGVALKGEQIRLIEEALPQKYKDLVDFVIDYFDDDVYPRLNNIYKKRFGVDMPKEERYLPITGLSNISAGSNIFNDHAQYAGFKMNNQKFRTGARIGWGNRNLDFIGDVLSSVANTEHVIATYSTIRRAESVFNSEAVQKELNKSSDVAAQWIKKYLSKVARGTFDSPSSAIIELTSHLRQNAAASLTALNIASWLKTFAPLIAIKKDVETGAWFDTLSDFGNYDKLHEFAVNSSKLMATRRDTNRIEVAELSEQSLRSRIIPTGEITSQVLSGYKKVSKKFKEAGWAVYGALDSYSTTMAWTAKYKEVAGKTGNHELAIKEADRIINVYFPSGRIDQLPFFFTSGGLEKQLTAFTADMNRMLNLGYSGTQLKDGKVQEAIMFVAFPVVLSSLYLAGTDFIGDSLKEVIGLRDEDKERDKQFWRDASRYGVSQFVGGIPLVGQLVEGKTAQLVGDDAAAWFLSQNNMVFTSAFQDAHRDNYISASSKLLGVPGANYFSYAADKYLKSITKQDKDKRKSISEKWDF